MQYSGQIRAYWFGTELSDAEFLAGLADSHGTIDAFLEEISAETRPRVLLEPGRRQEYVDALRDICPEAERLMIAAADQVLHHSFDLLGSSEIKLGEKIDWHLDFISGHRFPPKKSFALIRPAPFPGGHDIKVPWELSRCQHFARLGQAYWFTNDEKYAQEYTAQVLDWIEQNPPQFGVNWACTMDVAIRAVNWLLGFDYFGTSSSLTDNFRRVFYKSLLSHGRHIYANLEGGPSKPQANNHYIANLVGLIWLGLAMPFLKESASWLGYALPELWQEVMRQTHEDGVDFEASIPYHRFITEMILKTIIICRCHKVDVPQIVLDRLEQMLDFLQVVTRPDGRLPILGDQDNGRLTRLAVYKDPQQEWVDAQGLLVLGAHLYQRSDWLPETGEAWQDAIWLLGPDALEMQPGTTQPAEPGSKAFSRAGTYVLRGNGSYVLVDAGSNGQNGAGGHGHNDLFSFELFVNDQAWIIDPGTGVYTSDYGLRNHLRSSKSHNVVVVDEQEIHPFSEKQLFMLSDSGEITVEEWNSTSEYARLAVEHTCYHRFADPVTTKRTFEFHTSPFALRIIDKFMAAGSHKYECYLHLAEGVTANCQPEIIKLEAIGKKPLYIRWKTQHESSPPLIEVVSGNISPSYGVIRESWIVSIKWEALGDTGLMIDFSFQDADKT